ncbi:hypothetical protein FRC04_009601 [Tulasnella sp. 424]|nr:hypothetical protein FRC04_009601 [Tulasnella sp. 424]KAG8975900.1 hypothetical protein FRC05_004831 [Tulasnella sp. 425]
MARISPKCCHIEAGSPCTKGGASSTKGKGKASKGKGKAGAASPNAGDDDEENEDQYDIDSPWQSAEAGDFFDETEHSLFDTRREKELATLLETHTGEDFRVAWQLNLVNLLKTDETIYVRAKLRIHKYSSASYLLRHINNNCKKGLLDKVEPKSKRRKNNLAESTSTQDSAPDPSVGKSRPALADFRRGNTPRVTASSDGQPSTLPDNTFATEADDPVPLAGPSTSKPKRAAANAKPTVVGAGDDSDEYVDDEKMED